MTTKIRLLIGEDSVPGTAMEDWLATQEFPARALYSRAQCPASSLSGPGEPLHEPTADWLHSQEFPIRPLLSSPIPASSPAGGRKAAAVQSESSIRAVPIQTWVARLRPASVAVVILVLLLLLTS